MPRTDSIPGTRQYLAWVQRQADALRAQAVPPASLADWQRQRAHLRDRLRRSWGEFPAEPCPLEPQLLGELRRDGYRIERRVLQPRDGILMTTNVYVPDGAGPFPAVLCVHGHWRGAKQDPTVQARCIGLAKLGFLVLCVDAFGAGERGIERPLGEYHGEMVAATLWPAGLPLSGLQIHENMRAVDYLQSRPDVDPNRLGVTGASGGGNQSMYVGAMDERLKSVVPVCSVGTYRAYLGAACCLCEVVPGAMAYTEEWGVLGLVAPRGLMVVSATRDAFQFSVEEARKSIQAAEVVFELFGQAEQIRHAIFESPHDYNQAMREAMYGWMTFQLKGEGTGEPIAEPPHEVEDPEILRCFPGDSRPASFRTLPQFAAAAARHLLARRPVPDHVEHWQSEQSLLRDGLEDLLGGPPDPVRDGRPRRGPRDGMPTDWEFAVEPNLVLPVREIVTAGPEARILWLLDLDRGREALDTPLAAALRAAGWSLMSLDLRATASLAHEGDRIQRAPDHNTAQWGVWLGQPLLGQWVRDLRRLIDQVELEFESARPTWGVAGVGTASLVALSLAALDERITHTATLGGLASYVSEVPYAEQRLALMVPGILGCVGDIGHIASLLAPRRLVIAGGVSGGGEPLAAAKLEDAYAAARHAYRLEGAAGELHVLAGMDPETVVRGLGPSRRAP